MNKVSIDQNPSPGGLECLPVSSIVLSFPSVGYAQDAVRRTEQSVHESKLLIEESDRVIQRLRLLDCC